jgi:hypothetical protein
MAARFIPRARVAHVEPGGESHRAFFNWRHWDWFSLTDIGRERFGRPLGGAGRSDQLVGASLLSWGRYYLAI